MILSMFRGLGPVYRPKTLYQAVGSQLYNSTQFEPLTFVQVLPMYCKRIQIIIVLLSHEQSRIIEKSFQ